MYSTLPLRQNTPLIIWKELFFNSCWFSQLHFIARKSASLVFKADGGWLARWLAGLVDTWHIGRLQMVLHPGDAAATECLHSALRRNLHSPYFQCVAGRAGCDWNVRHVCAPRVKDVFQSSSPLIITDVWSSWESHSTCSLYLAFWCLHFFLTWKIIIRRLVQPCELLPENRKKKSWIILDLSSTL